MAMIAAYEGSCHCGAIAFTFKTSRRPESWSVRACQCAFCRRHGARTTSDPEGSLAFRIADESQVQRYRFGLKTADFLVCRTCGTYTAAVLTTSRGHFATVNMNALQDPVDVRDAEPMSYERETHTQRLRRRERNWTPVA